MTLPTTVKGLISFFISLHVLGAMNVHSQVGTSDGVTLAVASEYQKVTAAHRLIFGENYRSLWATPSDIKVLRLDIDRDGLAITTWRSASNL